MIKAEQINLTEIEEIKNTPLKHFIRHKRTYIILILFVIMSYLVQFLGNIVLS